MSIFKPINDSSVKCFKSTFRIFSFFLFFVVVLTTHLFSLLTSRRICSSHILQDLFIIYKYFSRSFFSHSNWPLKKFKILLEKSGANAEE